MDRRNDLHLLSGYQVVIDAAGPFHAYGDDPYRLPRAAIAAGLHYLDLADNAQFCAGIAALDAEAKAAEKMPAAKKPAAKKPAAAKAKAKAKKAE